MGTPWTRQHATRWVAQRLQQLRGRPGAAVASCEQLQHHVVLPAARDLLSCRPLSARRWLQRRTSGAARTASRASQAPRWAPPERGAAAAGPRLCVGPMLAQPVSPTIAAMHLPPSPHARHTLAAGAGGRRDQPAAGHAGAVPVDAGGAAEQYASRWVGGRARRTACGMQACLQDAGCAVSHPCMGERAAHSTRLTRALCCRGVAPHAGA